MAARLTRKQKYMKYFVELFPIFQEFYLNELCRKPFMQKLRFCWVLLTTRGYDARLALEYKEGDDAEAEDAA